MLTRRERKKVGALGDLNMIYRWTFAKIIKSIIQKWNLSEFFI